MEFAVFKAEILQERWQDQWKEWQARRLPSDASGFHAWSQRVLPSAISRNVVVVVCR